MLLFFLSTIRLQDHGMFWILLDNLVFNYVFLKDFNNQHQVNIRNCIFTYPTDSKESEISYKIDLLEQFNVDVFQLLKREINDYKSTTDNG